MQQIRVRKKQLPIVIEPGRAIVGNAGVLLTRVNYLKRGEISSFCVVDAGMNDLIRPALYQAYQEIIEVDQNRPGEAVKYDVVGPVCESSDFLGKERHLKVGESDLLAVRTSGAYSAVMSSNYNARPRPAEVMVDGDRYQIVKKRESVEALYHDESVLPT
jgi:diaminopimelate decarboxylase